MWNVLVLVCDFHAPAENIGQRAKGVQPQPNWVAECKFIGHEYGLRQSTVAFVKQLTISAKVLITK